jgi:hypothetical protein
MSKLTEKQLLDLYEDFVESQKTKIIKSKDYNRFCNDPECPGDFINHDYMKVCKICGSADEDSYIVEKLEDGKYIKKKYYYKRRIYFEDRLKYISGIKRTNKPIIQELVDSLDDNDINDVRDLYKIMKKRKMSVFYKDIYNIYYDLKKIRLINININDISKMSEEFVKIDLKYKSNSTNSNMLSYNSLIYYLLQKFNIEGSEYIFLPANHNKNMLEITRIDNP